jgi:predicted ATPase
MGAGRRRRIRFLREPCFFIRNRGFITRIEARQISFEETLHFERIHQETYPGFGFALVPVEPGDVRERVSVIKAAIR